MISPCQSYVLTIPVARVLMLPFLPLRSPDIRMRHRWHNRSAFRFPDRPLLPSGGRRRAHSNNTRNRVPHEVHPLGEDSPYSRMLHQRVLPPGMHRCLDAETITRGDGPEDVHHSEAQTDVSLSNISGAHFVSCTPSPPKNTPPQAC
ncbi:hypothetical protein CEXT_315461 [Caerostris extrusa]|uniref:Uncharacterized protein n=1 Tax=Caerostris extrusa TaxID=172846 RepID=A0AAV4QCN4_CAEEX|nr:hypothetical protein CEXT_315461 [Caerostris extrusa]